MAILVKASVTAGQPAQFQLNLGELLALPAITDSYFKVIDNLQSVIVSYSANGQQENMSFKIPDGQNPNTPVVADFSVSQHSREAFQFDRIILVDENGGTFKVERSAISGAAGFDVSVQGGQSSGGTGSSGGGTGGNGGGGSNQMTVSFSPVGALNFNGDSTSVAITFSEECEMDQSVLVFDPPVNITSFQKVYIGAWVVEFEAGFGDYTLTIPEGAVESTDHPGKFNAEASKSFSHAQPAPENFSVSVGGPEYAGENNTGLMTFNFSFSSNYPLQDFDESKIQLSNATVTRVQKDLSTGSVSVQVAGTSSGVTVTAQLLANAASDQNGGHSTASGTASGIYQADLTPIAGSFQSYGSSNQNGGTFARYINLQLEGLVDVITDADIIHDSGTIVANNSTLDHGNGQYLTNYRFQFQPTGPGVVNFSVNPALKGHDGQDLDVAPYSRNFTFA